MIAAPGRFNDQDLRATGSQLRWRDSNRLALLQSVASCRVVHKVVHKPTLRAYTTVVSQCIV